MGGGTSRGAKNFGRVVKGGRKNVDASGRGGGKFWTRCKIWTWSIFFSKFLKHSFFMFCVLGTFNFCGKKFWTRREGQGGEKFWTRHLGGTKNFAF